jgi:hypothetical protein
MEIDDVLREMSTWADGDQGFHPGANVVQGWLRVLRPALAVQTLFGNPLPEAARPLTRETFPLRSSLPQGELHDLHVVVDLRADHEGQGAITLDYAEVPEQHRLQALLSIMGSVGERIAYAIGEDAYLDLLRGVVARRSRHG